MALKIGLSEQGLGALVSCAQAGSEAALEEIVFRYKDRISRFVRVRLRSGDSVEDICHSVLVSVITGLASLKEPASFESWLFRIARNTCFESIRRERLRRMFVPFEQKHEQLAAVRSPFDDKLREFKTAVEKMPNAQKRLILLLLDNDWSYEELAAITGSTVSSVKSRLFRAREFLRQSVTRD